MLPQEHSSDATRATYAETKTPLAEQSRLSCAEIFLVDRRLRSCCSAVGQVAAGNGLETRCDQRPDRHRDRKQPKQSRLLEASRLSVRSRHPIVRTPHALHFQNELRLLGHEENDCGPCTARNSAAQCQST